MNRSELIRAIQEQPNLAGKSYSKATLAEILDAISATLHEALVAHDEVALRGIGKFSTYAIPYRPARRGVHPKTGRVVEIPEQQASHRIRFRPAKELREAVAAS